MDQTLSLFSRKTINLEAPENADEKEHFLSVIKTVLATEICNEAKDLTWVKDFFPKHHHHKHSQTASSRSAFHVDPPKPLDEKKSKDMTVLLEMF